MSETTSDITAAPEQRLDPRWIIYSAVQSLRALIVPLVIMVVSGGNLLQWFGIGAVIVFALGMVALRGLMWTRISYQITDRGIRFVSGLLSRNERLLPADRVQAIDFQEGVIHRLLGVVAVKIESAAGAGSGADITLEALSRQEAERLRGVLLLRGTSAGTNVVAPGHVPHVDDQPVQAEGELIANVPYSRLLIAGLTSGRIGPALGLVFAAIQFGDDILPEDLWEAMIDSAPDPTVTVVGGVVLLGSLLAWLFAVVSTVLTFGNFELRLVGQRLQATYGLLERRRVSLPLNRIQAVVFAEGVLRQPFGLAAIRAESAGYGKDSPETGVLMPILWRREIPAFLEKACPDFRVDLDALSLNPPPPRAMRRYVLGPVRGMVLIIAAVFAAAILIDAVSWLWGWLAVPLVIPAALLGWLRYRDDGWSVESGGRVIVRGRPFHRVTTVTSTRRVQHRTLTENPLQRRAGLVSFQAAVASGGSGGAVGIAHLDRGDGIRLVEQLGGSELPSVSLTATS